MHRTPVLAALLSGVLVLLAAPAALGAGLQFSSPLLLPHGDPKAPDYVSGGEPSLAFDPTGDGHVYVTAPQFIPVGVNEACNQSGAAVGNPVNAPFLLPFACSSSNSPTGVAYWASDDHGNTWSRSGDTGTANGGGDSDVAVLADDKHTVLTSDLEAADASICISHDFAKTWSNCSNGITADHTAPENDREWLTAVGKSTVYMTYHDFNAGFPIIERSDDGGQTWAPCGNIIDPSVATTYTPQGGTLVAKPMVAKDGTIYVEFITPDSTAPPVGATLDNVYIAVAKNGCSGGTQFKNYKVFSDTTADLGKIFLADAIDGGGQLYILAAGKTNGKQTNTGLWLFTSTDGGQHWSQPIPANPPELTANVFPWVAGGPNKGQIVIGWFGTNSSPDPNNLTSQWRYYAGESLDGGQSFAYTTVTPDVIHYGDICTQGIFCGVVPPGQGNRNLADFASVGVDPSNGCAAAAIPGDPYNRPDLPNGANNFDSSAYFSRQTSTDACFTQSNAGAPAGTIAPPPARTPAGAPSITTCADHIAPVSRVSSARVSRTRVVRVRGRSSDRGCGTGGAGKVARVRVAVGRRYANAKCRFLKRDNRFGPLVSCLRTTYLSAHGTTRWSITLRRRLPRGRYVIWVRGIDASGNVEHKARRINLGRFRVR